MKSSFLLVLLLTWCAFSKLIHSDDHKEHHRVHNHDEKNHHKHHSSFKHVCGHTDISNIKFNFNPDPLPYHMTQAHEFELRNQGEEGTWKPIRFLADYSNVNLS